ncbi:uncharacterized protein LOC114317675 [Camellia sinensis]|uniref:uncharacterized protein LOC114317675 n=1 Tax=Camellia sinensis TaxID=4442 RepID=UPI001035A1DE|nr:uncharacterized protein LOC114317675 [Camellia sinensis]
MGSIDLPITIGKYPQQSTKLRTFLIIDCPSAYNIILGRTALNALQAVTSTYHLAMKFPTDQGVGIVRGEQTIAQECYVASLKKIKMKEAMTINGVDVRDEEELVRGEPVEELVEVPVHPTDPTKTTKIGNQLSSQAKADLTALLAKHNNVFSWTHSDMPGIDLSFITHRLGIESQFRSFRQKQCIFHPKRNSLIVVELDKLLKAQFIRNVDYPRWLSNVILVRKNNGEWRLCVDYSALNQAYPKDSYSLPRIYLLVNATLGHQILSFMDGFSGYNQILMHVVDQEHTSLIIDKGTYYYRIMSFGLKNARATYQRLVNAVFQHQIGQNMEVYVDDMLVKSKLPSDHLADLHETFQTLFQYQMKLNSEKCAFSVGSGPPSPGHDTIEEEDPHSWTLCVDGSSRKEGSGADLILTTPEAEYFKCAFQIPIYSMQQPGRI